MSKDKPVREWMTWVFRGALAGLIWWAVADWNDFKRDMRTTVAQHTADISYLKGQANGRANR